MNEQVIKTIKIDGEEFPILENFLDSSNTRTPIIIFDAVYKDNPALKRGNRVEKLEIGNETYHNVVVQQHYGQGGLAVPFEPEYRT